MTSFQVGNTVREGGETGRTRATPQVTEVDAKGVRHVGDVSPECDVMGWPLGGLSLKPHDPDAVTRRASDEAESRDTLQGARSVRLRITEVITREDSGRLAQSGGV